MLFRRILVITAPLLMGVLLEIFIFQIFAVYYFLGACLVLIFICSRIFIKESFVSTKYWHFVQTPVFLFVSIIGVVSFLESAVLRHVFIVFFVAALMLYFENLFLFYYFPSKYQNNSLNNITRNFNLITIFFLTTSMYAFMVLLNLPVWLLSVILIIVLTLLTEQVFWINNIDFDVSLVYLIVIDIIIFEFFWALSFLPLSFYVNGIIVTLIYFLAYEIFKIRLMKINFNKKLFWRNLIIVVVSLFVILISSRWI